MKELLAFGATLLIIAAYIPYIRDIVNGKTKPHVYSWFVSGLVTFIAFGLQFSHRGGWGSAPTFVGALAGFVIFALSLARNKRASITKTDTFFFVMALVATCLWLLAHQPLVSTIIISLVEFLAFVPTYRKSWSKPSQETVSTYSINALRHTFALIALQHYSPVTVLYPLTDALMDGLFALFLMFRRRNLLRQE